MRESDLPEEKSELWHLNSAVVNKFDLVLVRHSDPFLLTSNLLFLCSGLCIILTCNEWLSLLLPDDLLWPFNSCNIRLMLLKNAVWPQSVLVTKLAIMWGHRWNYCLTVLLIKTLNIEYLPVFLYVFSSISVSPWSCCVEKLFIIFCLLYMSFILNT